MESMLRFIIERSIEEVEPLPDEVEAIESKDELVDLEDLKQKLMQEYNRGVLGLFKKTFWFL